MGFDHENLDSNSGNMGMAAGKMGCNQSKVQKLAATIMDSATSMVSAYTSIYIYIYMIHRVNIFGFNDGDWGVQ